MRHSIYTILFLFMLPCSAVLAQSDGFGRLFTTPEQRATLNKLREQEKIGQYAPPKQEEVEETETPSDYYFNGYIKQNGRTKEVWVEKKGKILKSVDFKPKGSSKMDFKFSEGDVTLKPGQVFSPSEKKVNEKYKHIERPTP